MSELRVDKIVSSSGNESVEFTNGITIPSEQVIAGVAQTAQSLSSDANVNTTGIITATGGFVGDLTGTASLSEGLIGTPNITVGTITANSASFSGNVTIGGTLTYDDVKNVDSLGIITARSGVDILSGGLNVSAGIATFADDIVANGNIVGDSSTNISGISSITATSLVKSGGTSTEFLKADGTVDSSIYATESYVGLATSGLASESYVGLATSGLASESYVGLATSGLASESYVGLATSGLLSEGGNGSTLTGIVTSITAGTNVTIDQSTGNVTINAAGGGGGGGGSGEFNTGISSSVQINPLSYETSVFTFPSTAGQQYVIETINISNIDSSVGVGTTVNIVASIEDSTGEKTYIAYNVPVSNGGIVELLKNPIVAGPSDVIRMWSLNENYIGVSDAVEVYMNYAEYTSTEYTRKFASTVSIATTSATGIYTATSYPSVIESIHITNRTDTGDYPISISVTNGVTTTYLAKDLIIPRYSVVDILDRPKRVELNGVISVEVSQISTIDVIIAGKQITS